MRLETILKALAFWPVWQWYVLRMTDGSDEPWGIVALLTAFIFLLTQPKHTQTNYKEPALFTTLLMLFYIATYHFSPPLVHAFFLVVWLVVMLSSRELQASLHLGLLGLLLLSLPIIASMQFFLGYPLRLVTTQLVVQSLSLLEVNVQALGTLLLWKGELIAVDAPCSGIRMLWSGLYFCFTLSCFKKLNFWRTWACYSFSSVIIFFANALRTTLIFCLESKILASPFLNHTLIGLICFSLVVFGIFTFARYLERTQLRKHQFATPFAIPTCYNRNTGAI